MFEMSREKANFSQRPRSG